MACRGTGKLSVHRGLLRNLDLLRSSFGRPLIILSAYRTAYHNALVGGAPLSRHLYADACDISVIGLDKLALEKTARKEGFTGFGYYRTFLHIDLGRPRSWGTKW